MSTAPSSSSDSKRHTMDLHDAAGGNTRSATVASGNNATRNLIQQQQQLNDRKRFYGADYATKAPTTASSSAAHAQSQPTAATLSPAHVGASVLYNALGGGGDDTNVDMDGARADPTSTSATATSSSYLAQSTAAAARGASRYGSLSGGPAGGAASARSILLQKKLREKKHFDSADYQLAQLKPHAAGTESLVVPPPPPPLSTGSSSSSGVSPMEIDLTPDIARPVAANINSPSAASVAVRNRMHAQMSPSVRGGKYGNAQSGVNVLMTRKLAEKKRFDSADYHMETAGPAARAAMSKQQQYASGGGAASATQRFFVTAAAPNPPAPPPPTSVPATATATVVPAAPQTLVTTANSGGGGGGSKYGKLSAVNVLIRKKLKERKRFDSADYAMEKQGRRQPLHGAQGGATGALQDGHVVMDSPITRNVTMTDAECMSTPSTTSTPATTAAAAAAAPSGENKSISHQVKHIKLSEGSGGWATRVPTVGSPASGSPLASGDAVTAAVASKGGGGAVSHDSRLAARNLIIQRKLSERKRFDSADYFKEAAGRGPRR